MRCWPPRAVLACEAPCAVLLSPLFNQAPNQHPICDRKKGVAQCKTYSSLRLMSASVAAECTLTPVGWPSLHSLKRAAACLQSGCISEWRRATTLAAFVCLHTRLLQDSVPLYFPCTDSICVAALLPPVLSLQVPYLARPVCRAGACAC